jgi:hypothetical protein
VREVSPLLQSPPHLTAPGCGRWPRPNSSTRRGRPNRPNRSKTAARPKNVWFAKQILPPIIYEGNSGLGIDAHGNLMYAAANYQTVESPAKALPGERDFSAVYLRPKQPW